ncbi:MAG: hypothetical protein CL862_00180 [Cyanobium sp. NAT70]|nr:hypothetical protein [Cyanobium sp. NAT70]
MGLTHCPICIGLALLSAVRFMAHVVLALQLKDVFDQSIKDKYLSSSKRMTSSSSWTLQQ